MRLFRVSLIDRRRLFLSHVSTIVCHHSLVVSSNERASCRIANLFTILVSLDRKTLGMDSDTLFFATPPPPPPPAPLAIPAPIGSLSLWPSLDGFISVPQLYCMLRVPKTFREDGVGFRWLDVNSRFSKLAAKAFDAWSHVSNIFTYLILELRITSKSQPSLQFFKRSINHWQSIRTLMSDDIV